MQRPQLIASYTGARHARLASVLRASAQRHCPEWDVQIAADDGFAQAGLGADLFKLTTWMRLVDAAEDGTRLLLIDCDTLIVRPLDDIWAQSFDVAYTGRDATRAPINAGVIFVRAGLEARQFFFAWYLAAIAIRDNDAYRAIQDHGACDQAGLYALLRSPSRPSAHVLRLPCQEWNCADAEWASFDAHTRIVHVKGELRDAVLDGIMTGVHRAALPPLVALWRQVEAEATISAR